VEQPAPPFTAEEVERARAYHRPLYLVWPIRLAADLAVLAALAFSGLGAALLDPLDGLLWWVETLAVTAVAVTLTTLVTLPFGLWAGFLRERRFGFATQSAAGWVVDRLKGLVVGLVLGGAAMFGLVGLARAFPRGWPVAGACAGAALVVVLGFVAPIVLEPLFNRFGPLEDDELVRSLRQLATDAGLPVEHVLVADASRRTTKQNAYVSGLGRTRRLVLFDTLVARTEPRQIRVILAHELGHRRARHIVKGVVLGIAGIVVFVVLLWALLRSPALLDALDVTGAADPRLVPFVLLLGGVPQLVGAPLGSALSRRWEREADRISLDLTHDPAAFEAMMRSLALANLADLDPPRLAYIGLFSHPTPPERIAAARAYARG
jgi:STE24 endopeptidase